MFWDINMKKYILLNLIFAAETPKHIHMKKKISCGMKDDTFSIKFKFCLDLYLKNRFL